MRLDLHTGLGALDPREFGISALFAAVVLFVAAMVMLNRNVAELHRNFDWAERAHLIQKRIDDVNNRLNSVEMTVRGYALTGDVRFLERYSRTHASLMQSLADLGRLARTETAMRPAYNALEVAVSGHEALYATLIGHGPGEQGVVATAISDPAKRVFSARANAALTLMERTERDLFAARYAEAGRQARNTYHIAIAIAGMGFVVGVLGFGLTLFGRRRNAAGTGDAK